MEKLLGKTLSEIYKIVEELKFPKYTAKQIADWLYKKDITSIEEMSNLSKKMRKVLSNKFEIGADENVNVQVSVDGTKKYLFPAGTGFVETAYIPEKDRTTLCVSSQVGCKYACKFCMTGRQGFSEHLTAGEIINQVRSLPEKGKLTNIVYMGMGEPFDNIDEVLKSLEILTADYGYAMSPKRITVSTIGVLSGLRRFLDESNCHLAISLHTPFEQERLKIMPSQKANPLSKIINIIKKYDFSGQRRVSFEYIVFKGFNDSPNHINEIANILKDIKCRVNLIRFHKIPNSELRGMSRDEMERFKNDLRRKGLFATGRASRGQDIDAACGMLSSAHKISE